jgi:hypothetical protein
MSGTRREARAVEGSAVIGVECPDVSDGCFDERASQGGGDIIERL